MALLRSIATVGGFTMMSRVLGFARHILIANFLGAGMVADAIFVAFRFPNLLRRLFAGDIDIRKNGWHGLSLSQ